MSYLPAQRQAGATTKIIGADGRQVSQAERNLPRRGLGKNGINMLKFS